MVRLRDLASETDGMLVGSFDGDCELEGISDGLSEASLDGSLGGSTDTEGSLDGVLDRSCEMKGIPVGGFDGD